jgi:heme/copper-type cytochrome/quinol oxidase subunit 2
MTLFLFIIGLALLVAGTTGSTAFVVRKSRKESAAGAAEHESVFLPLTVVTLGAVTWRALRARKQEVRF